MIGLLLLSWSAALRFLKACDGGFWYEPVASVALSAGEQTRRAPVTDGARRDVQAARGLGGGEHLESSVMNNFALIGATARAFLATIPGIPAVQTLPFIRKRGHWRGRCCFKASRFSLEMQVAGNHLAVEISQFRNRNRCCEIADSLKAHAVLESDLGWSAGVEGLRNVIALLLLIPSHDGIARSVYGELLSWLGIVAIDCHQVKRHVRISYLMYLFYHMRQDYARGNRDNLQNSLLRRVVA